MIGWQDIEARKVRLDKLGRGLARECSIIGECDDGLHFVERRAYLKAISDTIQGLGAAKVALAKATQRHAQQLKERGEG
jgi:hypothetical protein